MAAKGSRERVKTLLKDTITLLCKNGLEFKKKFNVEALIGVTLDDDEVMLISLNEVVKADKASSDISDNESENLRTPDTTTSKTKKHRSRKRPTTSDSTLIKEEPSSPLYDINTGTLDNFSAKAEDLWGDGDPPSLTQSLLDDLGTEAISTDEPASKRRQLEDDQSTSRGPQSEEGDPEEEDEDLVFVKEEVSESMLASCSMQQSQAPQSFQQSQFSSTFSPEISQDGSMVWSQSPQRMSQRRNFSPRMHASTSAGVAEENIEQLQGQSSQPDPKQSQVKKCRRYRCSECGKCLGNWRNYQTHMNIHKGIYRYRCIHCDKGFTTSANLRGHMSWHTGVSEFKCDYCGKQYRHKYNLNLHKDTCGKRSSH